MYCKQAIQIIISISKLKVNSKTEKKNAKWPKNVLGMFAQPERDA